MRTPRTEGSVRRLTTAAHALLAQHASVAVCGAVPAVAALALANVLLFEQTVVTNRCVAVENAAREQYLVHVQVASVAWALQPRHSRHESKTLRRAQTSNRKVKSENRKVLQCVASV